MPRMTTIVYTDGACSGNPGPGGWAWAVPGGAFASGAEAHTTNQRMEITAAYEALLRHRRPRRRRQRLDLRRELLHKKWYVGWQGKGWKNSKKQAGGQPGPLGAARSTYVLERGDVDLPVGQGPQRRPMNDLVDRLAVEAASTQQGRSGDRPPDASGRPTRSGGSAAPAARRPRRRRPGEPVDRPDGHVRGRCSGTGPRSSAATSANSCRPAVQRRLGEVLAAKAELDEDLVVLTGLRLGAEMLAAEAAARAGRAPTWRCCPTPDPDGRGRRRPGRRFGRARGGGAGGGAPEKKRRALAARRPPRAGPARRLARPPTRRGRIVVGTATTRSWPSGQGARAASVGDEVWIIDPGKLA